MKIAFVNPSVGFSERRKSVPIGLAYIMAYLEAKGYQSDGYDFGDSTTPPAELVRKYELWKYDLVGLSVYNESFHITMRMAEEIKFLNPASFILTGGPQATATHETIMSDWKLIDGVIRKEGELPTHSLVEAIDHKTDLADVPSLTWRDSTGTTRVNCEMVPLEELDSLPYPAASFTGEYEYPPLHFFDKLQDTLRPAIAINTSRSCPYNCNFCGVLTIGRRYRSRTPASISNELEFFRNLHGRDYTHVYFSDANFFVRAGRALDIVRELNRFDDRVTFSFGTRVNQVLRARDVIKEMRSLGLRFIELGIENASPAVLARLAKGVGPSVNEAAVRLLNRLGVDIALDYIMIDPASTIEDLQLNMRFLERYFLEYYPPDHFYTSLALYEGTPAREMYEERRGGKFETGVLPATRDVLERSETVIWWEISQGFRRDYQRRIDVTLAKGETLLRHPAAVKALAERSGPWYDLSCFQLDVISLKHAPVVFFRRLIDLIADGKAPKSAGDDGLNQGYGSRDSTLDDLIESSRVRVEELADLLQLPLGELDQALHLSGAAYE